MADNVTLNAGSGGAALATDEISGAQHQRVKIQYGTDGSATDVSDSNPLPIDDAGGSLTVDNSTLAVTGGGTESTAMRVTIASDSTGLLSIDDNGGSITVDGTVAATNAGTFAVQEDGAALTALQVLDNTVIVDDAAFTPATTSVNMAGFTFDDVAPDSVDEGDAGAARMSANRNVYTTLRDSAGNERGANINASNQLEINIGAQTADITIADGGNSITVDNGGTFATQATLQAGTNGIGKLTANSGVDIGDVGVLTCGTVTPGTGATALGKAQDTAVGATDTGVAMLAQRDDEQAAVTPADGDYVVPRCDKFGNLKVTQLPDATSVVKFGVIDVASSGDNTLQAAAGAGIKLRVLAVMMISAGTVTARFESAAAGTALTGQMNLVANSGFTLPYNPAGWFETVDNELLNLELSGAISVDGCFTYVEV